MNATQGGANLLPGAILHAGVNLHQGANCAYKRGFKFGPVDEMSFKEKVYERRTTDARQIRISDKSQIMNHKRSSVKHLALR